MTPYRPTPAAATRYRVTVNGETLEGERFVEIISQLRERGYSTGAIQQVSEIVIAARHPGVSAVDVDFDGPVFLAVANVCPRCQGAGVTRWGAFVAGLAWLLAGLLPGAMVETPACSRCGGGGRVG